MQRTSPAAVSLPQQTNLLPCKISLKMSFFISCYIAKEQMTLSCFRSAGSVPLHLQMWLHRSHLNFLSAQTILMLHGRLPKLEWWRITPCNASRMSTLITYLSLDRLLQFFSAMYPLLLLSTIAPFRLSIQLASVNQVLRHQS